MPKLLFLSRVTLICNICYLFAFIFRTGLLKTDNEAASIIIILGNFFAILLNVIVNIWAAVLFLKTGFRNFPERWLFISKLIFLIIQLTFLLT